MKQFAMSAVLAGALLALLPAAVLGHAEYQSSDPADKTVLTEQPAQISATFTERVKPKQSSLKLKTPNGDIIATGGVPAGGPADTMVIDDIPALDPGVYTVLWTTVALDGDGLKGSFTFTLEAIASAEPSAQPSASAEASSSPSAAPSVASSPTAAASPTAAPATPAPTALPAVSPSASADTGTPASGSDNSVGLLALAVVVFVVAGVGVWLYRRRAV